MLTYLLNNENYNSVSKPCVSIDYGANDVKMSVLEEKESSIL